MHIFDRQRNKLTRYLQGRTTSGTIERGIDGALLGRVVEYSRVGSTIQGIVVETEGGEATFSARLECERGSEILPNCSCGALPEQWCEHTVALLWRASNLGFLDDLRSFVDDDAIGSRSNAPETIAAMLREADRTQRIAPVVRPHSVQVSLLLDFSSDRLGVQVFFEDEQQLPALVREPTARALDTMLLQLLDDHGTWDDDRALWVVSSSADVEAVLGIAQEYTEVRSLDRKRSYTFASELLEARVELKWIESGAELTLRWLLPTGEVATKEGELVGTGPYWTVVRNTIYRLSSTASRLATLFTHHATIVVPRESMGPVLEVMGSLSSPDLLTILNPELQPSTQTVEPTAIIDLDRRDLPEGQFSNGVNFEITATVEFQYPPPSNPRVVNLPHRAREQELTKQILALGFEPRDLGRFAIKGDDALDFLQSGAKSLGPDWKVSGLEGVARGVRFSKLGLRVSLSGSGGDDLGSGKIDWFDCHVSLQQNNANVPLSSLFRNVRSDQDRWVQLDSGAFARVPGGGVANLKTTLGLLDPNFRLSNAIKSKLTSAQALSFGTLNDIDISVGMDARVKALLRRFNEFSEMKAIKPSAKFNGKLRSYQEEGLSWLSFLNEFEFGGILADEMGLGKTVQALAFIQRIKSNRTRSASARYPTLVVAPTSVMMNWCYEVKKFTPNLSVMVLHGPGRKALFSKIPETDVVITSYALLRLDRFELERIQFGHLLLDEAQNIKNPDAAVTKAAKALRAHHRLALTGTPTENRPMELWSIIDFLMPGYLGSSEFFKNFIEKPILEGGPGVEVTKFLKAKTKPFILRRTKAEVEKELPPKIESEVHVEMTTSQRRLYNQILEEVRPRVFDTVDKVGIRGASISILAALLRLRQVCNHPNSIESLKGAAGYESGKFNALKELVVEALESGKKILLFAQFREMLAIIRRWLEEEKQEYCYLDGETRNRQEVVDRFNSDSSVKIFLISLKAGGTGLNLASADTVIIYDPWWNPAVESQAVDRAHRIGQTRTVNVYRMITEESIEQKILELKARKAKIVDALVNENALSPRSLSRTDLEQLLAPLPIDGTVM